MMEIYTVAFFGHRQIDNIITVEDELYSITVDLMKKHEYVEFLVGRDGSLVRFCPYRNEHPRQTNDFSKQKTDGH